MSWELLRHLAAACNAIKTRDFYKAVAAPRLTEDGVNAAAADYDATFGAEIPDPAEEKKRAGKQYTIRDLENDIARIPGVGIQTQRKR